MPIFWHCCHYQTSFFFYKKTSFFTGLSVSDLLSRKNVLYNWKYAVLFVTIQYKKDDYEAPIQTFNTIYWAFLYKVKLRGKEIAMLSFFLFLLIQYNKIKSEPPSILVELAFILSRGVKNVDLFEKIEFSFLAVFFKVQGKDDIL